MSDLIFLSYEAICSLIGCLIYFAINRKRILGGNSSGKFTLYLAVFVGYIVLVLLLQEYKKNAIAYPD